jgi:DNA-binding beta-propeller fold protein YncE
MTYDEGTNTLRLSGVLDETTAGDKTSLRYLFTQGDSLESTSTHHADLTNPEGIAGEQGGCFDGTYYYQAFVKKHTASNEENNAVRIGKFDYKTGEAVAYSEVLSLNHANDMTINPQTGELFVAHNNPNRTRVSVLSTDTLTLLRTVELEAEIYGLSYCRSRDAFAAALSSSFNMRVLDANLALADDKILVGTNLTANYTRQGICSDDTFIYHVLWDGKRKSKPTFQNVISVYDWYGNFCGLINIAIGIIEPENISITQDGTLIVVASTKKGGGVYEIRPTSVRKK